MNDSSIQTQEASASGLLYCQQAKELLGALTQAIHQLTVLHQEQFNAVVGGDLDSTRIDYLIQMANERKHQAKYAYLHHLETHGCPTNPGSHN
jgi:tRNA splicing endonuclease